jgi:putative ATP-dependent endonuclease of the OLD family
MTFFDQLASTKLYIRNYKSFGNEEQGFDRIRPINLIVGRNNSGKSALLDLVQFSCGNFGFSPNTHNHAGELTVILETPVMEASVAKVFSRGASGGPITPGNHYQFGQQYIGRQIRIGVAGNRSKSFIDLDCAGITAFPLLISSAMADSVESPLSGKSFKRLGSDRDITPEGNGDNVGIAQNGRGFTNVIQRFINQSSLPNDLVERRLLEELNKIFEPDAVFLNIRVRQHQDTSWEVYLEEQHKGAISLSHSGSGLKTVLLVLGFIILMPHIDGKPLSEYVFAFEELENNLHPSLQRRLAKYVCESALKNGFSVFFTTHSSAVIDMLSHSANAQIMHVTNSGNVAKARCVTTYVDNKGVLDDLDVRASDLLQANGIIWVERRSGTGR